MAISFVNEKHSTSSNTVSEPTGTTEGDVLVVIIAASGGPTGWTKVGTSAAQSMSVYWIKRGASAPSLTWTGAGSFPMHIIQCYRGDATVPITVTDQSTDSGSVGNIGPSIVTPVDNCWLISVLADFNSADRTAPTGMTKRIGAIGIFVAMADQLIASAGATGTRTWSTSGSSTPKKTWSLAIEPSSDFSPRRISVARKENIHRASRW